MKLLDLCKSLGITPSEDYPYIYQGGGGFIYKSDVKPQYSPMLDGWVFVKSFGKYDCIKRTHNTASDYATTVLTLKDFDITTQTSKQSLDLLLQRLTDTRNNRDKYYGLYMKADTDYRDLEVHILKLLKERGLDVHNTIPF